MIVWVLFLGYAAALAFTEGAERALLGDFAPAEQNRARYSVFTIW